MKLGAKELLFVCVMIGLLVCDYFVLSRVNAKRAALETETANRQKALVDLRQSTAGIDDVSRKIDDLEKAIAFFDSKLPPQRDVATVLDEVTNLTNANGLQTKTFKALTSEKSANCYEQPLQIGLQGDFKGFYNFLLQLEKLPRLTRLTQMTLTKINDQDGAMQAQLTMSIFFEPDPDAKPAVQGSAQASAR